jgi:carbon-monoxide dehydrogenase medium subunit
MKRFNLENVCVSPRVHVAKSIEDAAAALAAAKENGARLLAGGTWVMRAPVRRQDLAASYVAIGRIEALKTLEADNQEVRIGACATHAEIAEFLRPFPEFDGLRAAAVHSANPAVRNMATIGGNICAASFAASDFAPALLSLDASLDVATTMGERRVSFSEFLAARAAPGLFVTRVAVRRSARRSSHVRLPLRKAGDYPVAIVSVSANIDLGATISEPRIAVGSVEQVAKRWTSLEQAVVGAPSQTQALTKLAGEFSGDFTGREGVEAPGWYRVKVLPGLVGKAFGDLAAAFGR